MVLPLFVGGRVGRCQIKFEGPVRNRGAFFYGKRHRYQMVPGGSLSRGAFYQCDAQKNRAYALYESTPRPPRLAPFGGWVRGIEENPPRLSPGPIRIEKF